MSAKRADQTSGTRLFSPGPEKSAQLLRGLISHYATLDLNLVVVRVNRRQVISATQGSSFRISRAKYEAIQPGMNDRTHAHRARLQRHKKRTTGKPVISQSPACAAQGDNFCMCAGISLANIAVPSLCNDFIASNNDRPDRNLTFFFGAARQ